MHGAQRSRRGRFLKGRESSARKLTPEWFAGNQGSGLISSILAADNHCQKAVYSGPKAFKNTMNEGPRLALQCWVQELPASSGWEGTGSSHTACALGIKDVGINNKYPDSQRWQKQAYNTSPSGFMRNKCAVQSCLYGSWETLEQWQNIILMLFRASRDEEETQ